ncbi:hypothetical protein ACWER6_01525 [Streptomyces sp. NPDC004009]
MITSIARQGEQDRVLSGAEQREPVSRYGLVDLIAGQQVRTLWDVKSRR